MEDNLVDFLDFSGSVKKIYNKLQDDLSREIFTNRCLYSLTGDYEYIRKIVLSTNKGKELHNILKKRIQEQRVIIDGAGIWGDRIYKLFHDIKWTCFCDKKKNDDMLFGIAVVSRSEAIEKYPNALFLITARRFTEEIKNELISLGVEEKNIISIKSIMISMENMQYFDKSIIKPQRNEMFIDGGCFDGETIDDFFKWSGNIENTAYAFEPDNINYKRCVNNLNTKQYKNIQIINKGLWCENTQLRFKSGLDASSIIDNKGDTIIEVVSIDEFLKDINVTFVKLDIEGAELSALKGAANTIKKYKPKLAICIYHKQEDFITLPNFLLGLNSNYKFYLRHYTLKETGTILYCI